MDLNHFQNERLISLLLYFFRNFKEFLIKFDYSCINIQFQGKRDLITGLKTRTNAGRPNWDKVFKQLQAQKKGKVTVFYCGPPQLAKTLRYKCDQYGFAFRKECF